MTAPRPFVAACAQMRSGRDPLQNRDAAVALVREAAGRGAHYVQTPEMTSLVERSRAKPCSRRSPPRTATRRSPALREVARENRRLRPCRLARRQGRRQGRQPRLRDRSARRDPRLLRQDPPLRRRPAERRELARIAHLCGRRPRRRWRETPWGYLGVTICYDVRFPALYRALAEAGASFLSAPACFTRQTGEAHWHVLHRARAIETGAFMISAAQGGKHEDGRETYGHSLIVDPWGRVLAEAGTEPGVILAEIDPAKVRDARQRIPALRHAPAVQGRDRRGSARCAGRDRLKAATPCRLRRHGRVRFSNLRLFVLKTGHDPLRPGLRQGPRVRELVSLERRLRGAAQAGLVACPFCGSAKVEKQIMAPRVARGGKREPPVPAPAKPDLPETAPAPQPVALFSEKERELRAMVKALREHVEKNAEHVGGRFPDEARKMHYGDIEHRSIYGEATPGRGPRAPRGGHRDPPAADRSRRAELTPYSSSGFTLRPLFTCDRRALVSSRRRLEASVGRVGRRGFGRSAARRRRSSRRSRASSRLRSWVR